MSLKLGNGIAAVTLVATIFLAVPRAAEALPMAHIEISGDGSGEIVGVPGSTGGSPGLIECRYNGEVEGQSGICEAETGEAPGLGLVGINVEHRELMGSEFGGWTIVEGVEIGGGCSGFSTGCGVISLGGSVRIRALFATEPVARFHLLATKRGTGDGTVSSAPAGIDCSTGCASEGGDYLANASVRLHATPNAYSIFSGWRGCDTEPNGDCEVTMSAAREVEAEFNEAPKIRFVLIKLGQTKGGAIISTPLGIDCGPDCRSDTAEFREGEAVVLYAIPEKGFAFVGWLGCDFDSGTSCHETAGSRASVIGAVFVAKHSHGQGHRGSSSSPPTTRRIGRPYIPKFR